MDEIIESLQDVLQEMSIPRAAHAKIEEIIAILQGPGDQRLRISKALNEIEELSDNTHLPSFVRTQLWDVASKLEYF